MAIPEKNIVHPKWQKKKVEGSFNLVRKETVRHNKKNEWKYKEGPTCLPVIEVSSFYCQRVYGEP